MADRNVLIICRAEHLADAETVASWYPGGAGTFGVPLTTVENGTVAEFYAGAGAMPEAMVDAFEGSGVLDEINQGIEGDPHPLLHPYEVYNLDGTDVFTLLANRQAGALYRVTE